MQGTAKLIHYFNRTKPFCLRGESQCQACQQIEQFKIALDNFFYSGTQYLDRDFVPIRHYRKMHLGH